MFILLIVYSFFLIVRPQDYSLSISQYPIMKILLYLLIFSWIFTKKKSFELKSDLFLILFYLSGVIAHLSHLYFGGAVWYALFFLPNIFIYLIIKKTLDSQEKIESYLKYLILFAVILSLHGILQYLNNGIGWTGQTTVEGMRIRYIGIFSDPNDLALFFNMILPLIIYFVHKYYKWKLKILFIIPFFVLLYAIYLTQSRGAIIGIYAMLNLYFWKRYGLKKIILVNLIVLPVIFMLEGRMTQISAEEESAYGRIDAWYAGFQMLKMSPLFGVGPKMFTD